VKNLKMKKFRDETGLFVLEGDKFVREIPAEWRVSGYIVAQRYAATHSLTEFESRAAVEVIRDSIFDSIADTISPQGILAVCEKRVFVLDDVLSAGGFFLLGENLSDPGNIGTMVRTAAAAGANGVILTSGSGDMYNPKVLRASAGAVLRVAFIEGVGLAEAVNALKLRGIPIYAAHPRGDVLPYALDMSGNFCLLVGNESLGLTEGAADIADALVTLPMVNSTESLNASVAGSVLMYEAVRQRLHNPYPKGRLT